MKKICEANIPLYNAIKEYSDRDPIPFHMPGHKLGRGLPVEFLADIARLDLTELPGTDNLHHAKGAIMEAQMLAARAFGADHSYFLVNGSTCGIQAAISTVCKPGDTLIVNRDCHKSVISGMMLADVKPVYLIPEFNEKFHINAGILPGSVQAALEAYPDAAGVLVTRPSYYGICSDLPHIAEIVHSYRKPLIVDEAHGAHLRFNTRLPVCAMDAGADISIQSAHKTLPAFTQGAYLHVRSSMIDQERLEFFLGTFQTSSPSYVIMAFLDIAREIMQQNGNELLDGLLDSLDSYRKQSGFGNIKILERADLQYAGGLDETRIVVNFRDVGITGFKAEEILRDSWGIQAEMSDYCNIVCIAAPSDTCGNLERLFSALQSLDGRKSGHGRLSAPPGMGIIGVPVQKAGFREILLAPKERVRLEKACGRLSGGIVCPYPPGIPVLCPGEVITQEVVEYLLAVVECGGAVEGLDDNGNIAAV